MNAEVKDNPEKSRYELDCADGTAFIEYSREPSVRTLLHTEVPEACSGQGLGAKLASFAFNSAAKNNEKVKVECSYLRHYLQKHPEHKQVVIGSDAD